MYGARDLLIKWEIFSSQAPTQSSIRDYIWEKGVRRLPPHRPHSTARDYYWTVLRLRFQSLLNWLVSVINQISWSFLIPGREDKVNITSPGQQTLLIMICAAGATLPTAALAAPNFEKISHKFFSDPNQDLQSIGYRRPIFQINFVWRNFMRFSVRFL